MMRVLQIFNQYRSTFNGEESVVFRTAELIERNGGQCRMLLRSSREIQGLAGKMSAVMGGIYNPRAARRVSEVIGEFRPDVVHVHNLYPLFSPSAVVACRKAGVPVVMTLHNQALTCPRADHLRRGQLCDSCLGGREYNCLVHNCRDNWLESLAYAARSMVARRLRLFQDNVTLFIALTNFARNRLVQEGYDAERIVVLPNMAPSSEAPGDAAQGEYVAFAGRLSAEKGVEVLMAAAAELPDVPFRIAGGGPLFESFWKRTSPNVQLLGQLSGNELDMFYRKARLLVVPSLTYEMCPLVIGEAMSHGLPVVASRIGGLPELVREGHTGLLFEPGNSEQLTQRVGQLWHDPDTCQRFGEAGWETAQQEYSEPAYWRNLTGIYRQAMGMVGGREDFDELEQATDVEEQFEEVDAP